MENVLVLYYDTPRTARVRQIGLKVIYANFRQVVMSEFHIYPIEEQRHDQKPYLGYWHDFGGKWLIRRWINS